MAFLAGSFFPLDGAPPWLQGLSHLLPLCQLNDGMLDVMVRGEGPPGGADADADPGHVRHRADAGVGAAVPVGDDLIRRQDR